MILYPTVNIYIICRLRNSFLHHLRGVHSIFSQPSYTKEMACFTNTKCGGNSRQFRIRKSGQVFFHKCHEFLYLHIAIFQAAGKLIRIRGIYFGNTGGINCQNAVHRGSNINKLIARHMKITSLFCLSDQIIHTNKAMPGRGTEKRWGITLCIVFFDPKILRVIFRKREKFFQVIILDGKHQCTGLHNSCTILSGYISGASHIGQISISCTVYEYLCAN